MKVHLFAIALLIGSNAAALPAEKVLKFKSVNFYMDVKNGEYHYMGVTVFPDGGIGTKDYFEKRGANGADSGHSTYYFANGTIEATFTGTAVGTNGGHYKGQYAIVSGTGDYQGATGTGTIDGVYGDASPLKNAILLDIELDLKTP